MLFTRFFKQPKPNKFGYTPVYYNEKKEQREQRIKEISREMGIDKEEIKFDKEGFRERFSSQVKSSRTADNGSKHSFNLSAQSRKSNIRLLAIILIIGLILYLQFG